MADRHDNDDDDDDATKAAVRLPVNRQRLLTNA